MNTTTQTHNTELGLKAIPIMPNNPISSSSSNILTSGMLYSSSFSSIMTGEYIGMESCIDLNVNIEGDNDDRDDDGGCCYYDQRRKKRDSDQRCMMMMKKKEYPPPIKSLARTENQPSHMPWVLKRYYTNDGRLILREEKVRHHEYFKAHRSNGRLTLQLVHLDDDPICSTTDWNEKENEKEDEYEHCIDGNDDDDDENDDFTTNQFDLVKLVAYNENENDGDGDQREANVVKLPSPANESSSPAPIGGGGNGKCLIYSDVSKISPCLFEVPAIRPVH